MGDTINVKISESELIKVKILQGSNAFNSMAWGGLTGTLADQTDLQSALDLKASSGALSSHTSDVSNPHSVSAAQVGAYTTGEVDSLVSAKADKTITVSAGSGLSGGGDLSANRSFVVDIDGLDADASPVGSADYVMIHDASAGGLKKVLLDDLTGGAVTYDDIGDPDANCSINFAAYTNTWTGSALQFSLNSSGNALFDLDKGATGSYARLGFMTAGGLNWYLGLNTTNTLTIGGQVNLTSGNAIDMKAHSSIFGLTATTGTQAFLNVAPNIKQTLTAGYTGILLNVTETTTGSGTKKLIDLQKGGVSKFDVDNAGNICYSTTGIATTIIGNIKGTLNAPARVQIDYNSAALQSALHWTNAGGTSVMGMGLRAGYDQAYIYISATTVSHNLCIGSAIVDYGHAASTDPTVWIHSASGAGQSIYLWHDRTDGNIDTQTGTLNLGATGNVNFAGATRTATTVTHDGYVELEIAGTTYKFMLGS